MATVQAVRGANVGGGGDPVAAQPTNMTYANGLPVSSSQLEWTAPQAGSPPKSKLGQELAAMTPAQKKEKLAIRAHRPLIQPTPTAAAPQPTITEMTASKKGQVASREQLDIPLPNFVVPGETPSRDGEKKPGHSKKTSTEMIKDRPMHKIPIDTLRSPDPIKEDIPSNHKLTDPVAMHSIEERTLTEFDDLFRQKNYYMGVLVLIELGLMLLIFQYPWSTWTDATTGKIVGKYDSDSSTVWILQCVISGVTVWHLYKIWDYYQLIVVTDRVKYSLRNRDGIFQSFRLKYMLVEMTLVLLHAVPYVMISKPELFIFGRTYQLFRVIRDHSPVYRWRKKILTNGHLSGLPEFDVSLTLRTYFHLYPWPSLFVFISWWILVLSYSVYIFERELQVGIFDFGNSIYFTAGTMATLGYGDLVPISNGGRTIAMCSVVIGILCSALLVTALLNQIKLTPNQVRIAEFVAEETLNKNEQDMAARLIQKAYRKWSAKRRQFSQEGVEVMTVTDDGIEKMRQVDASKVLAQGNGCCGSTCFGMYYRPPTDQEVLNTAKKNREMRYYRFLTNVANSSNINPINTLEQRMERMEDMMLYMLEVLASIQADQKGTAPTSDDGVVISTTENSHNRSPSGSRGPYQKPPTIVTTPPPEQPSSLHQQLMLQAIHARTE